MTHSLYLSFPVSDSCLASLRGSLCCLLGSQSRWLQPQVVSSASSESFPLLLPSGPNEPIETGALSAHLLGIPIQYGVRLVKHTLPAAGAHGAALVLRRATGMP